MVVSFVAIGDRFCVWVLGLGNVILVVLGSSRWGVDRVSSWHPKVLPCDHLARRTPHTHRCLYCGCVLVAVCLWFCACGCVCSSVLVFVVLLVVVCLWLWSCLCLRLCACDCVFLAVCV